VRLFDAYVMTDWSAASAPTKPNAANTIWCAVADDTGLVIRNFTTRMAVMAWLSAWFLDQVSQGKRVLAGFDFSFGYPAGAAQAITGKASWESLWALLDEKINDNERNQNNRFEVADQLNRDVFSAAHKFWGRPPGRSDLTSLPAKKHVSYEDMAEHRIAETFFPRAQPVWKMFTTGSVGGQSMMGIKHLARLRALPALSPYLRIWPFETAFEQHLPDGPGVVICELYPSAFPIDQVQGEVLDRAQVRSVVKHVASRDEEGQLSQLLAPPPGLSSVQHALMMTEEGSIMGAGRLVT